MTNLREKLNIFGWKHKNGKELRLNYEDIELEVRLTKIDIDKHEIEERCVVVSINDSDMFEEAKEKLGSRLGEGVYTFWYKRSEEEWIMLNGAMDYELCISHFKDAKRVIDATAEAKLIAAQRKAANIKPYGRLMMKIYAQLTP